MKAYVRKCVLAFLCFVSVTTSIFGQDNSGALATIMRELNALRNDLTELRHDVRDLTATFRQKKSDNTLDSKQAASDNQSLKNAEDESQALRSAIDRGDLHFDDSARSEQYVELTIEDCIQMAVQKLAERTKTEIRDADEAVLQLRSRVKNSYWQLWFAQRVDDALRACRFQLKQARDSIEKRTGAENEYAQKLQHWQKRYEPIAYFTTNRYVVGGQIHEHTDRLRTLIGWSESDKRQILAVSPAVPATWQPTWDSTRDFALVNNPRSAQLNRDLRAMKLNIAVQSEVPSADDALAFARLSEEYRSQQMMLTHTLTDDWRRYQASSQQSEIFKEQWIASASEGEVYREKLASDLGAQPSIIVDLLLRSAERELAARCNYYQSVTEWHKSVADLEYACGGTP